jgi:hypothetical protein
MTREQLAAREAWAMMIRADDPMPPWVALDYVQEVTDDRRLAFVALCRASMEGVRGRADKIFGWTISTDLGGVRDMIENTEYGNLGSLLMWIKFAISAETGDHFDELGRSLMTTQELLESLERSLHAPA